MNGRRRPAFGFVPDPARRFAGAYTLGPAAAASNWRRNQQLMASGFLSPQGGEQARTALATAEAAVKAAEANVAQARSTLGATGDENAAVKAAAAAVQAAKLDLERTHVAS